MAMQFAKYFFGNAVDSFPEISFMLREKSLDAAKLGRILFA